MGCILLEWTFDRSNKSEGKSHMDSGSEIGDKVFAYQFYPFDAKGNALKNLKSTSAYFNRMDKFNDPFEGRPVTFMPEYSALLDEQYKQVAERCIAEDLVKIDFQFSESSKTGNECYSFLKRSAERLSKNVFSPFMLNFGITCFTTKFENGVHPLANPLMWSHYADGFRGFCIEFDLEKLINGLEERGAYLQVVKYKAQRPEINGFEFLRDWQREGAKNPFTAQSIVEKYLGTKHLAWRYESEFRFFHDKICETTIDYPLTAIERVIVSEFAGEKNIGLLKSHLKSLGISEYSLARLHPDKYGVQVIDGNHV